MNFFKAAYCRIFQLALKISLPFLPYKDPKILQKVDDIPEAIIKCGKKNPLIVTGKRVRGLGLTAGLEEGLSARGLSFSVYDGTAANPTTENAESALKIYKESGCDCIIAFGGGSPMDCAKATGALVARPGKNLGELRGILKVRKELPLLIAVPTTAGTGSETTPAAVIVDSGTRQKYAVSDFPLIPAYAVLDGELLYSLPKNMISTAGMDALTHAVEAYIGRGGNKSSKRDALEACKLIFANLEAAYGGDKEAANNMLLAAHTAGKAFSKAYVGYVHALAHALGGKYDIPHGLANAVILPAVLREYGKAAHKKLRDIAVYCGLAENCAERGAAAEAVISKIESLNAAFGIGKTFPELKKEDIAGLSAHAEREANPLYPVPVLWDRRKLGEIYKKFLH